jgi:hypothetical protein
LKHSKKSSSHKLAMGRLWDDWRGPLSGLPFPGHRGDGRENNAWAAASRSRHAGLSLTRPS